MEKVRNGFHCVPEISPGKDIKSSIELRWYLVARESMALLCENSSPFHGHSFASRRALASSVMSHVMATPTALRTVHLLIAQRLGGKTKQIT